MTIFLKFFLYILDNIELTVRTFSVMPIDKGIEKGNFFERLKMAGSMMNKGKDIKKSSECKKFIKKVNKRFLDSKKRINNFLYDLQEKNFHGEKKLFPEKVIENILKCGSWLLFRYYYTKNETTLNKACFCKKYKLCKACAYRRAAKQRKKVLDYLKQNSELLDKHWYYIVLPVAHDSKESFLTVFKRVRKGLDRIRKKINDGKRKNRKANSFFSKFEGFFYCFEVTKNKNGWNVHINLLGYAEEKIDYTPFSFEALKALGVEKISFRDMERKNTSVEISKEWLKYADNSHINYISKLNMKDEEALNKDILEIFKYSLKFSDLDNDSLFEVYKHTYRKRLLGALGTLYGIKLDVDFQGDEEEEDLDYVEFLYKLFGTKYKESLL